MTEGYVKRVVSFGLIFSLIFLNFICQLDQSRVFAGHAKRATVMEQDVELCIKLQSCELGKMISIVTQLI